MASRSINTILSMQDKMSPKLVAVSKKVEGLGKDMQESAKKAERMATKFSNSIKKMAKKAAKLALVGASLAAAFIIKVGFQGMKELDEGARKVKSIAKDALSMSKIKSGLLDTSTKTGVGVNELADTQYSAISSGVKPSESLDAAVIAAKLSKAGFTDANSALEVLTSTMNVYGLQGQEAMQKISDKLLVTQNLGVTTVAELSGSIGSLTPIANSAGVSIDELMAGMASTTKNGLKTEEAVTSLKGIMTSVISPTEEAADMAKQLGIDFSVSAIKSKGFAKFLDEVKTKTGGDTEKMGKLFGNVRALSGALILSGKGFDDFNTALGEMRDSAGATDEAFKVMNNSIGAKFDKLKNTAKNVATIIMNAPSEAFGKMADDINTWVENNKEKIEAWAIRVGQAIADTIKWLVNHRQAILNVIAVFGGMMVLITIFKGITIAIQVAQVAMLIFNGILALTPVGWIAIAVAAIVAACILLPDKVAAMAKRIMEMFKVLKDTVAQHWKDIVEIFKHPIKATVKYMEERQGKADAREAKGKEWAAGVAAKTPKQKKIGRNALGTSYWKGGLTSINEHGPEIISLPSGSKVTPANKTRDAMSGRSVTIGNININAKGVTSDEVVNEVMPKLLLELANI